MIQEKQRLPDKAIVITIDDGYKDNYYYAYPVLRDLHVPVTMYIATGNIGKDLLFWYNNVRYLLQYTELKRIESDTFGTLLFESQTDRIKSTTKVINRLKRMTEETQKTAIDHLSGSLGVEVPEGLGTKDILSWDDIREMHAHGISFGAHTVNHPILTGISLEKAKEEILQSRKDIEDNLKTTISTFAYPNGGYKDFNDAIVNIIKNAGFLCAVTTIPRWISPKTDLFKLGRIGVTANPNQDKPLFSGLYGDLRLYRLM